MIPLVRLAALAKFVFKNQLPSQPRERNYTLDTVIVRQCAIIPTATTGTGSVDSFFFGWLESDEGVPPVSPSACSFSSFFHLANIRILFASDKKNDHDDDDDENEEDAQLVVIHQQLFHVGIISSSGTYPHRGLHAVINRGMDSSSYNNNFGGSLDWNQV